MVSFFVWKKPKYNEKTPNLPLVIDKLEHFFELDVDVNINEIWNNSIVY